MGKGAGKEIVPSLEVGEVPDGHHREAVEFLQENERRLNEPAREELPVVLAMEHPFRIYFGIEPVDAFHLPQGRIVDEDFDLRALPVERPRDVEHGAVAGILADEHARERPVQPRQQRAQRPFQKVEPPATRQGRGIGFHRHIALRKRAGSIRERIGAARAAGHDPAALARAHGKARVAKQRLAGVARPAPLRSGPVSMAMRAVRRSNSRPPSRTSGSAPSASHFRNASPSIPCSSAIRSSVVVRRRTVPLSARRRRRNCLLPLPRG